MSHQQTDLDSGNAPGHSHLSYAWVIFAVSFISLVICWGSWRSFGVFLKPLAAEFSWTRGMTAGPIILFSLMNGIVGIYVGRLVDRHGPKIIIPIFGMIMGIGLVLVSQITSLWQFYLTYGLIAGAGSAVSYIPFVAVVSQWFTRRRGMMLGVLIAGIGVGMMIIPPLIQILTLNSGWRVSYIVLGLSLCLAMILAGILLKLPPNHKMLPYNGKTDIIPTIPAGESRKPGLPFGVLLRSRALWILFFTYVALTLSLEMTSAHIVAYATDLNIIATIAATLLTVIGAASILGKVVGGTLSDRVGRKVTLMGTMTLLGISAASLPFAHTMPALFAATAIFGLAYGGYAPLIPAIIGDIFGVSSMGSVLGLLTLGAGMGAAVGPVLAGYIFDVQGSYSLAFWLAAALSVSAAFAASLLKPPRTAPR